MTQLCAWGYSKGLHIGYVISQVYSIYGIWLIEVQKAIDAFNRWLKMIFYLHTFKCIGKIVFFWILNILSTYVIMFTFVSKKSLRIWDFLVRFTMLKTCMLFLEWSKCMTQFCHLVYLECTSCCSCCDYVATKLQHSSIMSCPIIDTNLIARWFKVFHKVH